MHLLLARCYALVCLLAPAAFRIATIESNSASLTVLEASFAVSDREPFIVTVARVVSVLGELFQRPHTPVCSLQLILLLCLKLYLGVSALKYVHEWAFCNPRESLLLSNSPLSRYEGEVSGPLSVTESFLFLT